MYRACGRCGRIHPSGQKCYKTFDDQRTNEQRLRSTYQWTQKSLQIREQANNLCEVCRDQNIFTYDNLEVHHIEKVKDNKDLLLDDDNLICLCASHHKEADDGKIDKNYLKELVKKRGRGHISTL